MPRSDARQWLRPGILLEIFVLLNLGFLTFDIYLAHSVNDFRQRAEYVPLYFSGAGTGVAAGESRIPE